MINENDLALLFEKHGNIMNSYAIVEGMKAQNEYRKHLNEAPEYTLSAFEEQAFIMFTATEELRSYQQR